MANPKKSSNEPLTIEKLRTFKGLESLTESESSEILESLERLAEIAFECYNDRKKRRNIN